MKPATPTMQTVIGSSFLDMALDGLRAVVSARGEAGGQRADAATRAVGAADSAGLACERRAPSRGCELGLAMVHGLVGFERARAFSSSSSLRPRST